MRAFIRFVHPGAGVKAGVATLQPSQESEVNAHESARRMSAVERIWSTAFSWNASGRQAAPAYRLDTNRQKVGCAGQDGRRRLRGRTGSAGRRPPRIERIGSADGTAGNSPGPVGIRFQRLRGPKD
jgi:hypothetical protein